MTIETRAKTVRVPLRTMYFGRGGLNARAVQAEAHVKNVRVVMFHGSPVDSRPDQELSITRFYLFRVKMVKTLRAPAAQCSDNTP